VGDHEQAATNISKSFMKHYNRLNEEDRLLMRLYIGEKTNYFKNKKYYFKGKLYNFVYNENVAGAIYSFIFDIKKEFSNNNNAKLELGRFLEEIDKCIVKKETLEGSDLSIQIRDVLTEIFKSNEISVQQYQVKQQPQALLFFYGCTKIAVSEKPPEVRTAQGPIQQAKIIKNTIVYQNQTGDQSVRVLIMENKADDDFTKRTYHSLDQSHYKMEHNFYLKLMRITKLGYNEEFAESIKTLLIDLKLILPSEFRDEPGQLSNKIIDLIKRMKKARMQKAIIQKVADLHRIMQKVADLDREWVELAKEIRDFFQKFYKKFIIGMIKNNKNGKDYLYCRRPITLESVAAPLDVTDRKRDVKASEKFDQVSQKNIKASEKDGSPFKISIPIKIVDASTVKNKRKKE